MRQYTLVLVALMFLSPDPASAQRQPIRHRELPDGTIESFRAGTRITCQQRPGAARSQKREITAAFRQIFSAGWTTQRAWQVLAPANPTELNFQAVRYQTCLDFLKGSISEREYHARARRILDLQTMALAPKPPPVIRDTITRVIRDTVTKIVVLPPPPPREDREGPRPDVEPPRNPGPGPGPSQPRIVTPEEMRSALRIPRVVEYLYVIFQTHGPVTDAESESLGVMEKSEFIDRFEELRETARRRNMRLIVTATDARHRRWYQPEIMFRGKNLVPTNYVNPGTGEVFPGAEIPLN